MLNLKFDNVNENADATVDYDITFTQSFTVETFLREYLYDRDEWGYISINGPFWLPEANILIEFSRGEAYHINHELLESVRHKIVKKIKASGGWSRMDYELYVDMEGEG